MHRSCSFASHGGAGPVVGRDYAATEKHLGELAATCDKRLERGDRALDIVEFAVAELESSGLYVADRGSAPNSAGYVELDASIMHGPTRNVGAVAAFSGFVNPVRVARGVMEKTDHVLLAGDGAVRFAREHRFEEVADAGNYYTLPVGVTEKDLGDPLCGSRGNRRYLNNRGMHFAGRPPGSTASSCRWTC